MSATTKTIAVSDAASQLGLSETDFRKLLAGVYKNPGTVKKISLDNFKMIGEALQAKIAAESQPDVTEEEIEQPTEETAVTDLSTVEIPVTAEDSLTSDSVNHTETSINDNLQDSTEATEEESSNLAVGDHHELDQPNPDRTKIQLNVNLNLSSQVLDLNKITSALAVVTGEEIVDNFEDILSHTVTTGIDRVIQKVAGQTYQTIQQLKEVNNADFLAQKGRDITPTDIQSAIDQILQFI